VDEYRAKVAELSARAAVEANPLVKKELEVLIASYRRLADYAKDNSVVAIECRANTAIEDFDDAAKDSGTNQNVSKESQ
jgi:hypothetical protein